MKLNIDYFGKLSLIFPLKLAAWKTVSTISCIFLQEKKLKIEKATDLTYYYFCFNSYSCQQLLSDCLFYYSCHINNSIILSNIWSYDQMVLALVRGRKLGNGRLERLTLRRWPTVQMWVTKVMFEMQVCSRTGFLSAWELGDEVGRALVRNSLVYGKTRQRWHLWDYHSSTTSFSSDSVPNTDRSKREQSSGAGGRLLAKIALVFPEVSRPVRLHVASYRKPNHIELHSKGVGSAWVTDLS